MASSNLNTILFNGLVARLKAAGYNVSVEHVLDVHALLLSFSLNEMKIEEIKYLLTPLLAKTKDEQLDIYSIIDSYIEEKTGNPVIEASPFYPPFFNPPPPEKKEPSIFKREPELKIIAIVIGAMVTLALIGLLFRSGRTNAYSDPGTSVAPDTTQTDTSAKGLATPANSIKKSAPVPFNNNGFEVQELHAFEPKEKNINMQLSIILGLIAGVVVSFIVFRVKEYEYSADAGSSDKAAAPSTGNDYGKKTEATPGKTGVIDAGLPVSAQFLSNSDVISEDKNTIAIKKEMKKYGNGYTPEFNVTKSILSAVEKGGFYNLMFSYKKEQRKFLILLDASHTSGHIFNLFNFFIQGLASAGVLMEKYTYNGDVFIITDERKNSFALKELAFGKPEFNLVIFGDCRQFINPQTFLADEQKMSVFNAWQYRAIITPVDMRDWQVAETQLQKFKFVVVPAETGAVHFLIKTITSRQELSRKAILKHLGNFYPVNDAVFETASDVAEYLADERLFQLVCALAIHPVLNWSITLALYDALVKKGDAKMVMAAGDYNTLLKVARMRFLNTAKLSSTLRLSFLQSLSKNTEVAARKKITALLQQAKLFVPVGSAAYAELEMQITMHQFFLYAYNRKEFKQYASSKSKILQYWRKLDDLVIKDFVKGGNATLMPVNNEGRHLTVMEFMLKERERDVRKVSFLRVLTTLMPALLIYCYLISFKPVFAYPKGSEVYGENPVTLFFKKDSCSALIDSIKLSGNNIAKAYNVNADSTVLDNMEYGTPVTIAYRLNGIEKTTFVDCTNSIYIIKVINCPQNR